MAKKNIKISIGQGDQMVDLDYTDLRQAVLTLRAIDHEIRQKIIKVLQQKGTMTVTEIFVALRIEQSVASQHLAVLRKAGVVFSERHGKFIHYSLNEEKLSEIARLVDNLVD
jgi:DNA-binding transcriptional ArsR family regulator